MFKRSTNLILIAALLAGGAAWIANKWALNRNYLAGDISANESSVVVASLDIPYGQLIEEQHVKVIRISTGAIPEGAFTSSEEIVGKIASENAMRGDILRAGRFVDYLEGSTLASLIAKNKRALTVRVNDVIGVGGFLLPGNHVDLLWTRKVNKKTTTKTLITNLKILAVDQSASTNANDPVIVRAITLEVYPKQAEIIVKASNTGKIQMTLRNPEEEDVEIAEEPKKAVRRYQAAPTMTIMRGTRSTRVKQ